MAAYRTSMRSSSDPVPPTATLPSDRHAKQLTLIPVWMPLLGTETAAGDAPLSLRGRRGWALGSGFCGRRNKMGAGVNGSREHAGFCGCRNKMGAGFCGRKNRPGTGVTEMLGAAQTRKDKVADCPALVPVQPCLRQYLGRKSRVSPVCSHAPSLAVCSLSPSPKPLATRRMSRYKRRDVRHRIHSPQPLTQVPR